MDHARENELPRRVLIGLVSRRAGGSTEPGALPEGPESEVPPGPRNEPRSRHRGLSTRRLFGLGGVLGGPPDWRGRSVLADEQRVREDRECSGRWGSCADQPAREPDSCQGARGRTRGNGPDRFQRGIFGHVADRPLRCLATTWPPTRPRRALSGAQRTCAVEPSAASAAAYASIRSFERGATCPFGRGGRPCNLSR